LDPQATLELDALRSTVMVKALPESIRAHLEATYEILLNLAKKVAPEIDASSGSNSFFAKILDAVAYFYSYTYAAKDGARPDVLRGSQGLRKAFEQMEATMGDVEKKLQVKLTDLDDFMVFKWLLQEAQRKTLSSWVKDVFSKGGAAQASASGYEKSRATTAPDSRKKKGSASGPADLMGYFA